MPQIYLHLIEDGHGARLSFKTEAEIRVKPGSCGGITHRTSPIFPVVPGNEKAPSPDEEYFIGFFCPDNPLSFIARLIDELPRGAGVYYQYGTPDKRKV